MNGRDPFVASSNCGRVAPRKYRKGFCLIFAMAPFAFAPLCAQTPTADANIHLPTMKTEVGVVLVDVVVTGSKDKPVPDLRRGQFQIFEDGKPQTISFFEEHKGALSTEAD